MIPYNEFYLEQYDQSNYRFTCDVSEILIKGQTLDTKAVAEWMVMVFPEMVDPDPVRFFGNYSLLLNNRIKFDNGNVSDVIVFDWDADVIPPKKFVYTIIFTKSYEPEVYDEISIPSFIRFISGYFDITFSDNRQKELLRELKIRLL